IRMLGEGRGYDVEPVILVARDDEEYVRWIREGQFDLTAMDPWLYVKHGLDPYVRLDAVAEDEQGLAKRFQVVTRTDSGLNSMGRLAGKKIIARDLIHTDLGRQWLEALLTRGGFGTTGEFFGSFETSPKASGVVLPVYFGVRDVALVDAGGLAAVVEQNAQVGRSLRTVASSPRLSNLLMGTRNGRWPSESHRAVVVEGVLDLESIPEGRRVLALFRIRRFVEVPENQLASVRALHEGSVEVAADGARPAEDPGL
ncbi:MAG: PhnD/SsuA/transferrin family substrate-binding protein, partial [Verrucomicrobiales bacterium]|nr:PhnD/SsuA/transferrin family substrate-binding protein [Verrucomicrobiales bacterium]